MRKKFTFLALSAFLLFSLPSIAQNQALNLNGSNYVFSSVDVLNSNGDFTIEFWAYIDPAAIDGNQHQFVSEGGTDGMSAFFVGYDGTGNILLGDLYEFTTGVSTGIHMPTGKWTHIAVSYNSSQNVVVLYLNGVAQVSDFLFWGPGSEFRIGTSTNKLNNAIAKIDLLKTYNAVRSPFMIKRDMFDATSYNDPSLEAWYALDDNGTLTIDNLAQSGSNQDGTIVGDGTGPSAPNSWTYSPIVSGSNGLTFNGGESDQIVIPDSSAFDNIFNGSTGTGGTVEFWVNPASLSGTYSTVLGKVGQYSFMLSTNKIGIDNGSGTPLELPLVLGQGDDFNTGYPTNTWTHLAFVYDGLQTTTVYYNGLQLGTITGVMGSPVAGQPLTIGISKDAGGHDTQAFTGGIDEVRLWSHQQSDADIFVNSGKTLNGSEPGLISQYSFDQGTPNLDNTGLTVAYDGVSNNNGTLTNFQMTGTASNFNLHPLINEPPIDLPVILTKFTAVHSGTEALLSWTTSMEENSRDFTIERSTDNKTYSSIGIIRAAGKSDKPIDYTFSDLSPINGTNYYRLRQSDLDSKYTYSPVRVLYFGSNSRLGWYNTSKTAATVVLQQGSSEIYTLSDVSGHTLRQGQLVNGQTTVSNLPAGIYFVRVILKTGETIATRVVIF